jgi:hypothetical protein
MRCVKIVVCALLLSVSFLSCSRTAKERTSIANALSQAKPNPEGQIDYVATFPTLTEAHDHAAQVSAAGGTVEPLDSSGRIQHIVLPAGKAGAVSVADPSLVAANTQIQLVPQTAPGAQTAGAPGAATGDPQPSIDQIAESYLTARSRTGVEKLLARFPEADGRGIKVAVFDTGIDFGIEGLFKFHDGRQKLVGVYDLTGFGKVAPQALSSETPQAEYTIGAVKVHFADGVKPQKVQSTGTLDETQLSRDYLAPAGAKSIDLDEDGKPDSFAFAVGVNQAGKAAVWVDANRDGVFAQDEEMTDFNSTYSYIDLRKDAGPSGARALAVTITSPGDVQFHASVQDHSTGCSLIIGGDGYAGGRLRGMAPGVELVSFVLDSTGEDIYTLDQFMKMFLKAKDLGVDAISLSWGFATADLASARFVGDFLDREIASSGIVIGIAAGNDGPGLGTAAPDDYIPHQGFGLGALISEKQARNLYGWTGAQGDSVIWYSSFGPTRGGRLIPDVMSPLMTLVRHGTTVAPGPFYPFGGTSSATPAAIGSMANIQSLVKAKTGKRVDPRLLKLAVQATAHPLDGVSSMRQGPGVIDVNAAYDLYVKLASELAAVQADPLKKAPFAYELRAAVQLPGESGKAEGIRFEEFHPTAVVSLAVLSQSLIDPLTFADVLRVTHESKFFTAPDVVAVQATGGKLALQFDAGALAQPGSYSDVISFARADGLVLLRVPVVVEIPAVPSITADASSVEETLSPFAMWRMPLRLEQPSPVVFDGFVRQLSPGSGAGFAVYLRDANGINVVQSSVALSKVSQPVAFASPELPAGNYELIAFRTFKQPAVLTDISLSAVVRTPFARVLEASRDSDGATVALEPAIAMAVASARLTLSGRTITVPLDKNLAAAKPGFYGDADLGDATDTVHVVLRQSALDRAVESFLHMEVAFTDLATGDSLERGWVNVMPEGAAVKDISFSEKSSHAKITAYPNFTQWDKIQTSRVWLDIDVGSATPTVVTYKPDQALSLEAGQVVKLPFAGVKAAGWGTLELLDSTGTVLETVPLRLP